jgi:hypothetical protein
MKNEFTFSRFILLESMLHNIYVIQKYSDTSVK